MIADISESVGSKKQEGSFCYNCGHSLLNHAYYQYLDGHIIVEYETLVLRSMWMGIPVIMEIPYPCVRKGICGCKRFISKTDYETRSERN